MLNNEGNRLEIFTESIPKYSDIKPKEDNDDTSVFINSISTSQVFTTNSDGWLSIAEFKAFKKSFVYRLAKILTFFYKSREYKIMKTFDLFKRAIKELALSNGSELEKLKEMIQNASDMRQVALVEHLKEQEVRINKEATLVNNSFLRFVTEHDAVSIATRSSKKIKLTWIKNFNRPIPQDVSNNIQEAIEMDVFDNIAIMHYDPDDTGVEMTKQEKEKAKDPIAFGVFNGSNRLYFIDDWIDEYCDLTLDKLISMGAEEKHLTKDTIIGDVNGN